MLILSFVAIFASLFVITAPSTIISIIWLVVVFLLTAFILGIMGLTYAALTYVLVYVGAIAILFLFVVQLLDQRNLDIESSELDKKNKSRVLQESKFKSLWNIRNSIPLAFILGIFGFILMGKNLSLLIWENHPLYFINLSSILSPFFSLWHSLTTSFNLLLDKFFLDLQHMNTIITYVEDNLNELEILMNKISNYSTYSDILYSVENYSMLQNQITNLGEWIYGGNFLSLIVISIILLLSMVGPIVICWRSNH
jgi:NADH:ubiquinone oxidoreductase subunit 6 (subunit J)